MCTQSAAGCNTHTSYTVIIPQAIVYMSSLQPAWTLCELKSSKCKQTRVGRKKKRHACHSFDWGVCFFCVIPAFFPKKMIYIHFCVRIIYNIYSVYETRVPINESPCFLHPQSATAVIAVLHYDRSPRETTEHFLRYDFFDYCFNKYYIYGKKRITRLIKH